MNILNVNRFIRSAREVDRIAGLEPVLVGYLPACVLYRIVLPRVRILHMLENFGWGFHPEVEGDDIINSSEINSEKYTKCTLLFKLLVRHRCLYAAR